LHWQLEPVALAVLVLAVLVLEPVAQV